MTRWTVARGGLAALALAAALSENAAPRDVVSVHGEPEPTPPAAATAATAATGDDGDAPLGLAITALVIGVLGLAAGAFSLLRGRRSGGAA